LLLNEFVARPDDVKLSARNPWAWIPTLYLAEGLPNAIATTIAVVLYKALGISNTRIALYTGLFYLPWVVKPLWSPVVDLLKTRRLWIWRMQFLLAATLAGLAATLPANYFLPCSLVFFWLLAFSSATHDIAADGFYMLGLSESQQSFFVGVRNTVYRLANLFIKGPFIILVAALHSRMGDVRTAWMAAFAALAVLFAGFGMYHRTILPRPPADKAGTAESLARFFQEFFDTFAAFFRKQKIFLLLAFLLFFRFGEAQLLPMAQTFLLDARSDGGLGLTDAQFGLIYGTVGVIALMAGGIIGGILVSRHGLRSWIWPMLLVMHLPDAVFIYLAYARPESLKIIGACVALEQFGYGFGFTAYMLYMIYIARGPHPTAHYAICTGFMALGLMLPGLWSGWLQTQLGYPHFFAWVMLATLPGFIVTALVPLDGEFGKKRWSEP
jgi:MFS transporter, PAT family, beta-lactamase induction signal transducer AmpG